MQINSINPVNFKGTYTVDTGSATSKSQIFTLGALMNNFWITNPNRTFYRVRNTGVYGKVDFNVRPHRESAFESVLKNNNIQYTKKSDYYYA